MRRTLEQIVRVAAPVLQYSGAQKVDDNRYAGDVVCVPDRTAVPRRVPDIIGSCSAGGLM